MVTAIEVLDSAVKIGLGAAITGLATYLTTRRTHRHELKKLHVAETASMIRDCLSKVNQAATQLNMLNQTVQHLRLNAKSEPSLEVLDRLRQDYSECFNQVKDARSICVLLGYTEAADTLGDYTESINALIRYQCKSDPDWSVRQVDKLAEATLKPRNEFFSRLATGYQSTFSQ